MELNDTLINQTNSEVDKLLHPSEKRYKSVGYILSSIENIEDTIYNEQRFNNLKRNDFIDIANQLKGARNQIELLSGMDVIDDKTQEKQWSDDANLELSKLIKQENFTQISLEKLFENFIIVWTKIFLEIFDINTYTVDFKKEWWTAIIVILKRIFEILTKDDRLIYVGIGFVVASFFIYYILISA